MIHQRIGPSEISAGSREWTSHADVPKTSQNGANASQAKRYVESWIKQYPGVSLGASFCLGLCIGWLIKRK